MRTALLSRSLLGALALAVLSTGCSREGTSAQPTGPSTANPPSGPAPAGTGASQPGASAAASDAPAATSGAPGAPAAPGTPAATAQPGGAPGKLNVLVISIDSMRADMPWAGYPRDIAPNLTKFEKEAVNYTRHYAVSSYTAMSVGGFLSGRYPGELQRSGYFFSAYPAEETFFPELLQKASVRTMSAQAHFYFNKEKAGFHQGFDVWEITPGISADNTTDRNITSPQHLELAQKHLSDKANTGGTFFAFYHFLDPHDMYMQHEGIESFGKKARDLYDGEMKFTDQHVGKLIDFVHAQGWGKRTAIIITADHGEGFGEHKMYRHGFELWDMLTHVPLLIQAPGIKPRRIDTPRSSIDLAPTILELTGTPLPTDPKFQGTSLVPELYGKEPEPRDVIIDLPRTSDNDRRRALIHDRYKLIAYGDDEAFALYDLVDDPGETKDLQRDKTKKEAFEQMMTRYKERVSTIKDICPKMREKLKGRKKSKPC
ncbi:sulfatase [Chondromyces apiculatus]|uniref:Sulfatase n=1 Tax=Chondromyces apiculatus DSM 436 TaxID=1192034 RepID=A0A017TGR6_9BACT|nr:sulfatase [Chondromyces apiculatus]EYF08005.1 Sulfatase [Chondromyces apiculatus DSM 436]